MNAVWRRISWISYGIETGRNFSMRMGEYLSIFAFQTFRSFRCGKFPCATRGRGVNGIKMDQSDPGYSRALLICIMALVVDSSFRSRVDFCFGGFLLLDYLDVSSGRRRVVLKFIRADARDERRKPSKRCFVTCERKKRAKQNFMQRSVPRWNRTDRGPSSKIFRVDNRLLFFTIFANVRSRIYLCSRSGFEHALCWTQNSKVRVCAC